MSGFEANTGLNVHNHYGPRDTGGATGVYRTEGSDNELTVMVTGEILNSTFLPEVVIPAGSAITKAVAHVTEAFALSTSDASLPTIEVGTEGSEATNGATLTEAQAEAVGYYDITASLSGTWSADTRLAADTTVGVAMTGTAVAADATVGRVVFIITYTSVA